MFYSHNLLNVKLSWKHLLKDTLLLRYKDITSLALFLHRVLSFECSPFQRAFVCLSSAEEWKGSYSIYYNFMKITALWLCKCILSVSWFLCVCRYVSISSLSFSPDGHFLCASSNTETVHIFKVEQLEPKYANAHTHTKPHEIHRQFQQTQSS